MFIQGLCSAGWIFIFNVGFGIDRFIGLPLSVNSSTMSGDNLSSRFWFCGTFYLVLSGQAIDHCPPAQSGQAIRTFIQALGGFYIFAKNKNGRKITACTLSAI